MSKIPVLRHNQTQLFGVTDGKCSLCGDEETKCIISSDLTLANGEKPFVDIRLDLENNQIDAQFGLLNEDNSASVNSDWSNSLNINYCPICGKKLKEVKKELKMKTFKVPVLYQSWGLVEVEAENKKDLLQKLSNEAFLYEMPLPSQPEYVDGTYKIDKDSCFYEELESKDLEV